MLCILALGLNACAPVIAASELYLWKKPISPQAYPYPYPYGYPAYWRWWQYPGDPY